MLFVQKILAVIHVCKSTTLHSFFLPVVCMKDDLRVTETYNSVTDQSQTRMLDFDPLIGG